MCSNPIEGIVCTSEKEGIIHLAQKDSFLTENETSLPSPPIVLNKKPQQQKRKDELFDKVDSLPSNRKKSRESKEGNAQGVKIKKVSINVSGSKIAPSKKPITLEKENVICSTPTKGVIYHSEKEGIVPSKHKDSPLHLSESESSLLPPPTHFHSENSSSSKIVCAPQTRRSGERKKSQYLRSPYLIEGHKRVRFEKQAPKKNTLRKNTKSHLKLVS